MRAERLDEAPQVVPSAPVDDIEILREPSGPVCRRGSAADDDEIDARGLARPGSDVDIAVLLREAPEPELGALCLGLEGALERELGVRVDLVVLNTAHPELVHRVMRDGLLVLERDRSERIRFEVRARNEYFDLKPRLDEYRRIRQGPA